ncbi:p53 and DNA damage-regulated protein 1-like [Liolophura sinensis]|uniref:p53 and DNA damage-regulated protein 1-like n=1 Tax=Liolophura sinensis TaxID=3198878 RepID=UPI003158C079
MEKKIGPAEQEDKMLHYLTEVEGLAEDILTDKRQLVDLDKKRQKTREAIRAVRKDTSNKNWVCLGNTFIKFPGDQTKKLLNQDFDELDKEITEVRQRLKPKVNKLRDLEDKDAAKGFQLNPLSREEMKAIDSLL